MPIEFTKQESKTALDLLHDGTGGNIWFVNTTTGQDTDNGQTWKGAKKTIQAAVDAADAGDKIIVAPGQYDETVTVDKSLTIQGLGGRAGFRGSAYIEPETAGAKGMLVYADDVTLINLGVAGEGTADYALLLGSFGGASGDEADIARFRAVDCKFEGVEATSGEKGAVVLGGCGDVIFERCEFAWSGTAIFSKGGDETMPTQIYLIDCRFHNITTCHVNGNASPIVNINMIDCVHDNAEDGTAPTDYLLLDHADTSGIVTGCRFATATNATGVLTIGAKVMWVANYTEAGVSTARPA